MHTTLDPPLLALILETMDDAIVVTDEGGRIVLFNAGAERMFGRRAEEMLGQPLDPLLPEPYRERHRRLHREFLEGAPSSRPMALSRTVEALRASGETFPVAATLVKIERDGRALGASILRDISEQERTRAELLRLSTTDPLTGLRNRRSLLERAEQEIARAARHGTPLSLLVLDMDRFKAINDRYGHAEGDRVLVRLADCLRAELRASDVAGRLGGEEFAVVLPEAAASGALEVAERIRRCVETCCFGEHPPAATVSIGAATWSAGETVEALLRRADEALYAAKAAGRNRVVAAG